MNLASFTVVMAVGTLLHSESQRPFGRDFERLLPDFEVSVIRAAADRNGCIGDNYLILLAIRKAENGPKKREFGVTNPKANTLDKQAGWCAATIVKSRARWIAAGKPEDFIDYLQRRYAPINADNDPHNLNSNWAKNVKYWYERFKQ